MPINRIFENIQKILGSHGAKQVFFEYDDNGRVSGLGFVLRTAKGDIPVRLPARVEKVQALMEREGFRAKDDMQYYRTAWKNIHDWIDSQMALYETEMVKLEEIFLPYMVTPQGDTFFETLENKGFYLPSGNERE